MILRLIYGRLLSAHTVAVEHKSPAVFATSALIDQSVCEQQIHHRGPWNENQFITSVVVVFPLCGFCSCVDNLCWCACVRRLGCRNYPITAVPLFRLSRLHREIKAGVKFKPWDKLYKTATKTMSEKKPQCRRMKMTPSVVFTTLEKCPCSYNILPECNMQSIQTTVKHTHCLSVPKGL